MTQPLNGPVAQVAIGNREHCGPPRAPMPPRESLDLLYGNRGPLGLQRLAEYVEGRPGLAGAPRATGTWGEGPKLGPPSGHLVICPRISPPGNWTLCTLA